MPLLFYLDRVQFTATSGSSASFVESAAATGFQTMESAGAVSGTEYHYVAQSADLSQWEYGKGIWTSSNQTLTRTPLGNSLGGTTPVSFTAAPNVLITCLAEDLQPSVKASSNLSFFVSTAGSDTNPGSSALPFQTIQAAVNAAAQYNYQQQFAPTINLSSGTFDNSAANLLLPPLVNCFGGTIAGVSASLSTIKLVSRGILASFAGSNWTLKNLGVDFGQTIVTGAFQTLAPGASITLNGTINQSDSSGNNQGTFFQVFGGTIFVNATINITTGFNTWLNGGPGFFEHNGGTVNLPAFAVGGGWWVDAQQGSPIYYFQAAGVSFTNKANYTGPQVLSTGNGAIFQLPNGTFTDLPGVHGGIANGAGPDNSVFLQNQNSNGGWQLFETTGPVNAFGHSIAWSNDPTNGQRWITINDGTINANIQVGRTIVTDNSTNHILTKFDLDGRLEMSSSIANTVTVPPSSTFNPYKGAEFRVVQTGIGATTILASSTITGNGFGAVGGQWKSVLLYSQGSSNWVQANV